MCCRFWVECLHGHNSLGRSENNEPRQREYGSSVTLVRWPDGQNSPRLYALLPLVLRRWPANAGKNCPAILAVKRHAANPSVGVRRQLPLHKGAIFAWANTTGYAE